MVRKWLQKLWENLPYFVGVLALLAGCSAYYNLKWAYEDQYELKPLMIASEQWPHTNAVIVSHDVEEEVSGRFSHSPVTHFYGRPSYVFVVDGKEYSFDRVCPEGGNCGLGTEREDAQALLAEYPVGQEVAVYYDAALSTELSKEEGRIWAMLRPGYRPWIEGAIRRHWIWGAVSVFVTLLLAVFVVKTAPEFREGKD